MSAEDRRDILIAAAVHAFGRHGLDATSIQSIAQAAGVAKPSVYELFDSKEALFEAAVAAEAERLATMVSRAHPQGPDTSLRDRTRERVAAVFAYADVSPDGLRLLMEVDHGASSNRLTERLLGIRAATVRWLADVMRADFASGGIRAGASLDILAAMAVDVTLTAARRCFEDRTTDPAGVVEMVTSFLTGAFAAITPQELAAADAAKDAHTETRGAA